MGIKSPKLHSRLLIDPNFLPLSAQLLHSTEPIIDPHNKLLSEEYKTPKGLGKKPSCRGSSKKRANI